MNEKPLKRGSHVMSHGMMSRQTEPEQYLDVVDAVVTSQIVAKCNSKMPSSGMVSRTRFRSSSPLHGEVRTPLIRNATSLQRAHIMPILRQLWMLHQTERENGHNALLGRHLSLPAKSGESDGHGAERSNSNPEDVTST